MNGRGWFVLIVGAVIDELVLGVALVALGLVLGPICAPALPSRAFRIAVRNLTCTVALILSVLALGLVGVIVLSWVEMLQ